MQESLILAALITVIAVAASQPDDTERWQVLTKHNFSSQIRLYPNIILLVTVPWCGESRSLLKALSRYVSSRTTDFGGLKLMVVYRNADRMLTDAIGATEEIAVFFYHHSLPYKYTGRLRARTILTSVYHVLSASPEELPLKMIDSPKDLELFLDSTDKAVLLGEFCGYAPKLLSKVKKNGTYNESFTDVFSMGFTKNTDRMLMSGGEDSQKVVCSLINLCCWDHSTVVIQWKNNEDARLELKTFEAILCSCSPCFSTFYKMHAPLCSHLGLSFFHQGSKNRDLKCSAETGFSKIPWLQEFSSMDSTASSGKMEYMSVGRSCTFEDFQRFDKFFSKFITVTREFFLPPESHRFGLVSNRSLLAPLGVGDPSSWLIVHYVNGCPGCLRTLKDVDDLRNALQKGNSFVTELEADSQDIQLTLPANQPSVILFVDRSSDSWETRIKSKEALDAFRELASQHKMSDQMTSLSNSSLHAHQISKHTSGHPRLKLSPEDLKIKLKEKMSVMIINEDKHVPLDNLASDLQGSPMHEILTYLLDQKKEAKLSSLAKKLGFRLLSDDVLIKAEEMLTSETPGQSNEILSSSTEGGLPRDVHFENEQLPQKVSASTVGHDQNSKLVDAECSSNYNQGQVNFLDATNEGSVVAEPDFVTNLELETADDLKVEDAFLEGNLHQLQLPLKAFRATFFFSDGNYRLLRTLTGGAIVPSLVLVDPNLQQHYVFPKETKFSHLSLSKFLDEFLNGSLIPYQQSETTHHIPQKATRTPFVNLDFHEMDPIPRVTAHTFSQLVLGVNETYKENAEYARMEDVVVLFSNSWCGFCHRMELVVREVYRALKGYMEILNSRSEKEQAESSGTPVKLPQMYLIDCTFNDCSLIFKSMNQREVYPALGLFPARSKKVILYEGNLAVADVVKFVADHGSNSHHLIDEKGIIIWMKAENGGRNKISTKHSPETACDEEPCTAGDRFNVHLKDDTLKRVGKQSHGRSLKYEGSVATTSAVVVGSIVIATEQLLNAPPFDKSMVLVVKADQHDGFQGLIFNKHIRWDIVQLGEGLEFLKEAPLSFGGPIILPEMPLVSLTRRIGRNQYLEVLPGVYFLDQQATSAEVDELRARNDSVTDYWFFLGYTGWSWDQLFHEIDDGAWTMSDEESLRWPSN